MGVFPGEDAHVDDLARLTVGHLERGVPHFTCLFPEYGPQQALFGGELGLALGRDLAYQHVSRPHLGTDADDAPLVEVLQDLFGQVGDVTGDLLGAQLGVPGVDLVLLDMDGRQDVVLDEALGEDDGVLVVVALPGHEGDQQVLAQAELAALGRRPVGQDVAQAHGLALLDHDALVEAGVLVGPAELVDRVHLAPERSAVPVRLALLVLDGHMLARDLDHGAGPLGQQDVAGVAGSPAFYARAHEGRLRAYQGDRLLLHVGAHEGPVGVVVLDEGDQGRRDGDDLLGGNVHQVDFRRGHEIDLTGRAVGGAAGTDAHSGPWGPPHQHALVGEGPVGSQLGVGLGDDVLLLLVRRQVGDLIGDGAAHHSPVGRLDEAVLVDPPVGGQVADQPDVGTFGCLDRAHAPVVGAVHVPDLEPGPLPGQAARAHGREAPLVRETG